MASQAPLWSVFVVAAAALAFAAAAAIFDAALTAAAAGRAVRAAVVAPAFEFARLLVQQRRVTLAADAVLWRVGLAAVPASALLAALVVPFGRYAASDLAVGVVWFNAMEVLMWAALWLAGWGPNSPYALIGGYRFVAQGLAYELPHMLALITAALAAGSLRVGAIAAAQTTLWYAAWMPVAFLVYLVSAAAMSFWGPFDQAIAADLAGGVGVEAAGVERLLLFGGRYLALSVAAAFAVPLFLGGGAGPFLPAAAWSVVKTAAVLALLVWSRHQLPTLRMERYLELSWLVLLPAAIMQALVVALVVLAR